jgi:outer membrane biogenesis lipoprotein LolB
MKFTFLLIAPFLLAACVPEKPEEQQIAPSIQQEMDLHKDCMQGFGYMDPASQNGFFGEK